MDQLRALRVFVRVIDEGSFAAAARALDLAPAVVTRLVAELEEHLGARLINRTTRRLALTDIGEAYLERARRILVEVDEAEALATTATTEPRGHLRVLVPPAIAVHQLAKHLPKFHKLYPQVSVELSSPGGIETVDEAFDLTILHTRHPLDGEFVARRLARTEVILCASPEYLSKRGRPQHPNDLREHDSLLPPVSELQRGIVFQRGVWGDDEPGGESLTLIPKRPVLTTAHMDTNYAAALHGLGVAGLPSFLIEDALMEHALERVLPEWRLFSFTIWAAMPTRKYVPARTRAFLDFLVEVFGGEDRDPWLAAAGCETNPGVCGEPVSAG
ncbi:LysR substrate-binding domain-containing protein [Paucibacter sp. O1-1]|uniref:LysR family transcriptional regulator n=1 Tax=unclassified Roseateles TaxID=2626991 RepID=UPI0021D4B282|nr:MULTISPECIES: LysR family transcriptional regulator [unclassified Roseateles]MCU7370770.1 LysR substrate-binding domain-containing protein [Paucibacter sp. O1-1]MCZ7881528.1 LysR substrate-binding domain-containing protein [Paucibacter sp. M5-1]MDA3825757.1 LysR substrate-binding domain-containing protein [Paucibacter sp. O1-1]MDC6169464.1 LysR substrate-binding domain-containing protein [Paucibacter sp. XJ19-41]